MSTTSESPPLLPKFLTVAGMKGGVGKTTTAVHLANYFALQGPTVLVDGDPNMNASRWAARGEGFPFKTVNVRSLGIQASVHDHVIIDTQARPTEEDLEALVEGCDLLVIPTTPDALALDTLISQTLKTLDKIGSTKHKILLTIVPPRPSNDEDHAREALATDRLFKTSIRRFKAFQKAALSGCSVNSVTKDPRAAIGWREYRSLGEEIVEDFKEARS